MIESPPAERRRHERYPIYCSLEYKAEDDQPKESAITLNISEAGALISAKRELAVASNVILKLSLKGGLFFIIGKVKHVCRDALNDVYEIGLEFWDKPKTFAKKFYEELEGIMDYRRRYKEEGGGEISLAEASLNWYKDTSE